MHFLVVSPKRWCLTTSVHARPSAPKSLRKSISGKITERPDSKLLKPIRYYLAPSSTQRRSVVKSSRHRLSPSNVETKRKPRTLLTKASAGASSRSSGRRPPPRLHRVRSNPPDRYRGGRRAPKPASPNDRRTIKPDLRHSPQPDSRRADRGSRHRAHATEPLVLPIEKVNNSRALGHKGEPSDLFQSRAIPILAAERIISLGPLIGATKIMHPPAVGAKDLDRPHWEATP